MEASGAQAKRLSARVTVMGTPRDVEVDVVASADRVEFTAGGAPAQVSVDRAALLIALGVTEAEVRDL